MDTRDPVVKMRIELDNKDKQIAKLQEKLTAKDNRIAELEKTISQAAKIRLELSQDLREANDKLHRRNLQIADLRQDIADLKRSEEILEKQKCERHNCCERI